MTDIRNCACGGEFSSEALNFGNMPITSIFDNNDTYSLEYRRCERCSISSSREKLDPSLLYGNNYNFFSGVSLDYLNYAKNLALNLNQIYPLKGKRILDIACNDGTLSKELLKYGCFLVGVDPFSKAISELEGIKNTQVINDFFNLPLVTEFSLEESFDIVIVTNVISHVFDFCDFMQALSKVVKPGGIIYSENMNYERVVEHQNFEYFYHGVYNLMSPGSFNRILSNSFQVKHSLGRGFDSHNDCYVLQKYTNDTDLHWPGNDGTKLCQGDLQKWISNLDKWVLNEVGDTKVVGYAANSKAGLMFASSSSLRSRISVVLDVNKSKTGRTLAGTDILVAHTDEFDFQSIETVVLFAPHLEVEVEYFLRSKGFMGNLCVYRAE